MRRLLALSLSAALAFPPARAAGDTPAEDQLESLESSLGDLAVVGDEGSVELAARIDGAVDGDPPAPERKDGEGEPDKVEGSPAGDFKGAGAGLRTRELPAIGKDEQPPASQASAGPLGGLLSNKTLVAGGGALAGAMAGFMIAGPFGALIGAAIGLAVASVGYGFFSRK